MTPLDTQDPRLYRVSFPREAGSIVCPVGVYKGWLMTRTNLWIHFFHCHMQDTLVILEEENRPHPRRPACDMFVPWEAPNR